MKKIINKKMYNTETASFIGSDSYSFPDDFRWWEENLYRKYTGEFFLFGKGGPLSPYSKRIGQHKRIGDKKIIPLSTDDAMQWVECHLDTDTYEELFGQVEE